MPPQTATQIIIEGQPVALSEEFVLLGAQPFDDLHAIRLLGARLERSGCVRRTFTPAVVERERVLPTGITLGSINLAIPHADAYFAHRSALAVATLREPVTFHHMDDAHVTVPVHVVCLLAVADLRAFSGVLATVVRVMQEPRLLATICAAQRPADVLRALESAFAPSEPSTD